MSLLYAAKRAESLTPPENRPLEEATRDRIEAIAGAIERMGMSGVAPLLLRAFKPAAWAGGQLLWMLQPFAGQGRNSSSAEIAALASFFEDESSMEALIERLDSVSTRAGSR